MLRFARWRVILVVLGSIWALVYAAPNLIPENIRQSLPAFAPRSTVNLGLDLRGGSYMLLEANLQALQQERLESELDNMTKTLQDQRPRIG
ncbi:MAG: protein translocase subunit SecD, partial [Pseudomonadota bacterium]